MDVVYAYNKFIAKVNDFVPDFKNVSYNDFKTLCKFLDLTQMSYQEREEIIDKWREAFVQYKKDEPNYLEELFNTKSITHSQMKTFRTTMLTKVNEQESPDKWLYLIIGENFEWKKDEIKEFSLSTCKYYIDHAYTIEKEDWYDSDTDSNCRRDRHFAMTTNEEILLYIVFYHLEHLVDFKKDILRRIYKNTKTFIRIPPGNDIRILSAALGNKFDLLEGIENLYKNDDKISAIHDCRRQIYYISGRDVPRRKWQCKFKHHMQIEFPELCYVFPTHVQITFEAPIQSDSELNVIVLTGTSSIPVQSEDNPDDNACLCRATRDKIFPVSDNVCKWVDIRAANVSTVIHSVKIYGKIIVLF